ncbi:ATP-dependent (S)-NAD(P)H-hydrate dehydratase-like isoform X2 [Vigna angularis]|uniref:ATP-dependent (S)-NAD(P)H-hydrate dehydratase-like isoform X2 n=1 Tax=Phaseolus angularis TaxID=3914 RepID=UPI0022B53AE6|nr:ATP-dependent (S)-NAD(P)H-hydrate dehydratase-like isoform X2 [Vigna angularis]
MRHARQSNIPIVIDGDGLFLVTNNLDLVRGYPLAVLTPNVNEYKRLVQKVLSSEVNDVDAPQQLLSLAKKIVGVTILRKRNSDLVSDGDTVKSVSIYGSPRRCGGQGDILSGSGAVWLSSYHGHVNISWLLIQTRISVVKIQQFWDALLGLLY